MKKKIITSVLLALALSVTFIANTKITTATSATKIIEMYRLYNTNSGEHFYTAKAEEKDYLVKVGWNDEGIGWYAPSLGDPVYRVYNPNSGDHHYTLNEGEKNTLVKLGWKDEGVGWYSASEDNGTPLLRQYNPNATTGTHNYTLAVAEKNHLVSLGWNDEGVGWYAVQTVTEPTATPKPTTMPTPTSTPNTEPDYSPKYTVVHEGETCASGILDVNGLCHVGVCMSFDEVISKENEWLKDHKGTSSTIGDQDGDGCWILYENDYSFRVGDD